MAIVTVGIDLAKNVFAVHGVDETGKPALVRPEVPRAKLLELIANLAPCLIGMEACSGAHHWARGFGRFGHTVRLMAPKFVAPYRMSVSGWATHLDSAVRCWQPKRSTDLKVRLPAMRQHLCDLIVLVRRQPCQHILQVPIQKESGKSSNEL